MFSSIGWGEVLVLLVAALVILGPERLPEAARWTARALRHARDYATGATTSLKRELGPEFDDLRAPLSELRRLRSVDPRALITRHLLGDEPLIPDDLQATLAGLSAEKIDPANFGLVNPPTAAPAVNLTKQPVRPEPEADSDAAGAPTHTGDPAT